MLDKFENFLDSVFWHIDVTQLHIKSRSILYRIISKGSRKRAQSHHKEPTHLITLGSHFLINSSPQYINKLLETSGMQNIYTNREEILLYILLIKNKIDQRSLSHPSW